MQLFTDWANVPRSQAWQIILIFNTAFITWTLIEAYDTWARFLSFARSKLRLCSANHRSGYWSNLPCDWLSTAWAYSEQETENGPWSHRLRLMITLWSVEKWHHMNPGLGVPQGDHCSPMQFAWVDFSAPKALKLTSLPSKQLLLTIMPLNICIL